MPILRPHRRDLIALAAAWVAAPAALAQTPAAGLAGAGTPGTPAATGNAPRRPLPTMTEGPFYPPARWRARDTDWDADLTRVRGGGAERTARGEHLGLDLQVIDTRGQAIDGVEVEIWQCCAQAVYRHPDEPRHPAQADPGFQGFGAAATNGQGRVGFRTIRPVAYPGRTPHIHIKLREAGFGELTSQLFVEGDAGNGRDFLWRMLSRERQAALAMQLERAAPGANGLVWQVRHTLVVPA